MKKSILFLVSLIALVALASCSTTGYLMNEEDTIPVVTYAGVVEEDDYKVSVEGDYSNGVVARYLTVSIQNKSNAPIILDLNKSAYSGLSGSARMVDGSTTRMNANLSQPLYTVVPKSSMTRNLYDPSENGFSVGVDIEGAENYGLNTHVILCLTIDGKDQYVDVPLRSTIEVVEGEKIGEVSLSFSKWHFLFLGNTRQAVVDKAKAEAIVKYGEGIRIENIRYNGHWTPASLLLYFSLLGWVEKVEVTADVIK